MLRRALYILLPLALLALAFTIPIRAHHSRIDAATGSFETETIWLHAFHANHKFTPSPLEQRLVQMNQPFQRDWRTLHVRSRTLLGGGAIACGSAPAIYQLHPLLAADFCAASTDEELRQFLDMMQQGTDVERKAAVEVACEKGFAHATNPQ